MSDTQDGRPTTEAPASLTPTRALPPWPPGAPTLWTVAEAAAVLRTTPCAIYNRIRRGRLPAIQAGARRWLVVAYTVQRDCAQAVAKVQAASPEARLARIAALLPPRRRGGRHV